ncbi:HLA class III protein Dom3z [Tricharina praecox]|uniref:HLA class III protein Dom3z n=1 Tax=Tricharina praecox TaxID=43433 RepID=UPI0022212124|nr:HLA class III protein Dom3z [Tricharina praecox]KAI5854812.1 HLA class III protein Dom3z [Tricharina praecox]
MATNAIFPLEPLERFAQRNSAVRRPQEITHFSFDDAHQLRLDASSLRYYYPPELHTSLSEGFETFVKHDDSVDSHLDGLLDALVELEKKTGEKCETDIITWRGMMTKFMSLPFDMRNGFEMNATKFQDTIFIEESHAYKMATQRPGGHRQQVMSYWGYKFETLSTLPATWDDTPRETIESRMKEVVSNEAQFCSIVKTSFGDTGMILGGEVDAVWDTHAPSSADGTQYIELKTNKRITSDRDEIAFERKMQRFWAQSFLLGVGRVIVGFRDDDGILRNVKEFETHDLPRLASSSGRNLWDAQFSIDFTTEIVKWLKEVIVDDGVWTIRHAEDSRVVEVIRKEGAKSFLSEEFLSWRKGRFEGGVKVEGGEVEPLKSIDTAMTSVYI